MKIARFSRIGFILAAAGSAVGLGNIWKFPYIAGEYGGGAFVMVYLITVLLIGFAVMLAELLIGYLGRRDAMTAFEELAPHHKHWWKWGGLMAFTGLLIMTFYSVVIGWIFNYIFVSVGNLPSSPAQAAASFKALVGSDLRTQIFFHTLAFVLITFFVIRGIKSGIEKLNLVLMPLLFIIVGGMFLYATTLSAFPQAWHFMFDADWSKLSSTAFVTAVGHAFFTLSLGMGSLMTYAASLPKEGSIVKSALVVIVIDTVIALLAGLMLFTFLYQYGAKPSEGPGLVFISLPAVFYQMGILGNIFAVLFFIALAFAGLTSAVSLVEPMVQLVIDRFGLTRFKASIAMGLFFYLVGILVIYSGSADYGGMLTWGGKNLFDWIDYVTASIMLPVGGLVMSVFVGYVLERSRVEATLRHQLGAFYGLWRFSLRYVAPAGLVVVMLNQMGIVKF
jgi:neurotransmitter:Na+ symporter, NSS family